MHVRFPARMIVVMVVVALFMIMIFGMVFRVIVVIMLIIMAMIFIRLIVVFFMIMTVDGFRSGFDNVFSNCSDLLNLSLNDFRHVFDDRRRLCGEVLRGFGCGLAGSKGETAHRDEKGRPRHMRLQLLFDRFRCGDYLAQTFN